MFTGLIEHKGIISSLVIDDGGCLLAIAYANPILDDCHIGDSIAVDGVCLTVTHFDLFKENGWFQVWLSNETLHKTTFGSRSVGSGVNLERAMGSHARFGGHFVQGHVDTTASIASRYEDGDSLHFALCLKQKDLFHHIVYKGYVAIDGASLTVTAVHDSLHTFSVVLIKHTQEKITLANKYLDERVNIEVDMVGKYVERSVLAALRNDSSSQLREVIEKVVEKVLASK